MKKYWTENKLFISVILGMLFLSPLLWGKPIENVKQVTLENGMEVFLLEDPSDALVHIEFACKAGFSSQSQDNCGFFKLYTRLVKAANPQLQFSSVQCNADSSRYFLNIAAPQIEEVLNLLSQAVFSSQFTDEIFNEELEKLQNEVTSATEDMSVYINSAIDSQVFSDAPWKHDSGIYPPLFKDTTSKEARNHIKNISDKWYIPQNSAIFISGNINIDKILLDIQSSFGRFYSTAKTPVEKNLVPVNNNRKFVLHSPSLSPDLTQVVMQYTMLDMDQCDILAAALNNNRSYFKENLLSFQQLNIPGDEYINVSAAHQKSGSRLIIQTLMQPPANANKNANKKSKISSLEQAETFYNEVLRIPELLTQPEYIYAKNFLTINMDTITKDSLSTMENLSSFWAISNQYQAQEGDFDTLPSQTASFMMSRINKIASKDYHETMKSLEAENPFIFVIINSNDYNKNKQAYKQEGFQEITPENASWYVQEMYKEIKNKFALKDAEEYSSSVTTTTEDNQYYERNINLIKETSLKNGIKVITKENKDSTSISLLLSINGGKLNSAHDNGFEEIMINIIASMIEKEIYKKQLQGLIISPVKVSAKTKLSTSSILVDFQTEDTIEVCQAIKDSIIYGEIPPAVADKEVSQRRYKKRLENGSATNQMFSYVIQEMEKEGQKQNILLAPSPLQNIFESKNEILVETEYLSILAAYPAFIDACRYSIIIVGNFPKNIIDILEKSLGMFAQNNIPVNNKVEQLTFPQSTTLTVPINHTFLTDIPAEEAGPQPAVLIPTTEFLDPVMFVIQAPEYGTKESALFKAMAKYLEQQLNKAIQKNPPLEKATVTVRLPESHLNFATIIFNNVSHTTEVDSLFKTTILNINNNLQSQVSKNSTIQNIKNYWTLEQLSDTTSNNGTVFLIQEGFEQFNQAPRPTFYLEDYNFIQQATAQDFLNILNYFPTIPNFRVYSEGGKK